MTRRPIFRRTGAHTGSRRISILILTGVVAALSVMVAVRFVDKDDDSASIDPNAAYGVAHVHGLGVNPADGTLIVATHNGSFRVAADGDDAERIGDSLQDTMGFTVTGADQFLGSGHPDLAGRRAGQPVQLGLVESTDGGATWRGVSLGGEVDFHALVHRHDQVYGWDASSGRLMVSMNRVDWQTRSTLDLNGFAVDPGDAEHLVAAAPEGLLESGDGGRTWSPADGPQLVTLSWDQSAGLWGADAAGGVYVLRSSTWSRTGTVPGQPEAFLVTPNRIYAAAVNTDGVTGIYMSVDGSTWDLLYADRAP